MSSRPDGVIRAFGMSGAQLASDMSDLSTQYGIDLGFSKQHRQARKLENYDQFGLQIREQAFEMAEYYEIFYCLENSIRQLIVDTLREAKGADWWESNAVPEEIQKEVKSRKQKEVDSSITMRSENSIDYTTFGELGQIINKSWDLFAPIFTSQQAVQRILFQLNHLRNPIAHCCPISDDEKDRLALAVKDWFRVIA